MAAQSNASFGLNDYEMVGYPLAPETYRKRAITEDAYVDAVNQERSLIGKFDVGDWLQRFVTNTSSSNGVLWKYPRPRKTQTFREW